MAIDRSTVLKIATLARIRVPEQWWGDYLASLGSVRIEHDQGPRIPSRDQAPLDHLAGARHRRPVDPARRAAVAVGPQPVDLELGDAGSP